MTASENVHPLALELLPPASQRLVRTVDGLEEDALAAESLLPGWSRAHVVAHIALNAEALAGVLLGVAEDDPTPMYSSPEVRDADIAELADGSPRVLRDRLMASTTRFADAATQVPPEGWQGRFERTPGGPTLPVVAVPLMRWREVEIHHVDLDAGYSPAEWSTDFAVALLDSMQHREWPTPFRALARDLARTWEYGDVAESTQAPTVTGEARDLGWWVTGRGKGDSLTSDQPGDLPEVLPW